MRHLPAIARAVAALALCTLPHVAAAQGGRGQPPQGEFIAGPIFSPDGQRVAFGYAPSMAKPWQVHSIRIDGTDEKTLITGSLFAGPVAFSPDGKRLVYRLVNRDARGMLAQDRAQRMTRYMSSNPDGTDSRELLSATGAQATFNGWGPGGVGVVFTTQTGGGGPLSRGAESTFVVAIDGSQRRLMSQPGFWLRDGRIVSMSSGVTGSAIMIADRDGNNPRPLTTEVRYQRQPVASPDSKRIAFVGSAVPPIGPNVGLHLYIANVDGTGLHEVVGDASRTYNFSFSPDGTKLLYEDTRDDNVDIYVIDVDGRNERRLSTDPGPDELPVWSPDGTRIVFHSLREGKWGIYLVNPDGTGARRLR